MKVMVRGQIHYTAWTTRTTSRRYGIEIIADEITFLTRDRQATDQSGNGNDTTEDDNVPS